MVPQRDCRPRLIVDYNFLDVNAETILLAPAEAMQFGRALQRVLKRIVEADRRFGPNYLSKIDIADGFYRVWLRVADIPKLDIVLPTTQNQPPLIAFPLALPMGWVELPPYFTVLTETACDIANDLLRTRGSKLEEAARCSRVRRLQHESNYVRNAAPPRCSSRHLCRRLSAHGTDSRPTT